MPLKLLAQALHQHPSPVPGERASDHKHRQRQQDGDDRRQHESRPRLLQPAACHIHCPLEICWDLTPRVAHRHAAIQFVNFNTTQYKTCSRWAHGYTGFADSFPGLCIHTLRVGVRMSRIFARILEIQQLHVPQVCVLPSKSRRREAPAFHNLEHPRSRYPRSRYPSSRYPSSRYPSSRYPSSRYTEYQCLRNLPETHACFARTQHRFVR
jgi:hypothetical protein